MEKIWKEVWVGRQTLAARTIPTCIRLLEEVRQRGNNREGTARRRKKVCCVHKFGYSKGKGLSITEVEISIPKRGSSIYWGELGFGEYWRKIGKCNKGGGGGKRTRKVLREAHEILRGDKGGVITCLFL